MRAGTACRTHSDTDVPRPFCGARAALCMLMGMGTMSSVLYDAFWALQEQPY